MANTREIKQRIRGVNQTKKMTKAMKMMAAAKLKKARERHNKTKPYFTYIQDTMSDILRRLPNIDSVYFDKREGKTNRKTGYIVITSDKGLIGGYNHKVIDLAKEVIDKENSIVFPIGNVVKKALIKENYDVNLELEKIDYNIDMNTARIIERKMMALFKNGDIDELKLIYTVMKSVISLKTSIISILPLNRDEFKKNIVRANEELILKPSPEIVFEELASKYTRGIIYGGMVEAFVSEQLARMNAMDASTTNAENMVKKLTLDYNRARQASITQEITEIISGAMN